MGRNMLWSTTTVRHKSKSLTIWKGGMIQMEELNMASKKQYEAITRIHIEALENGVVPWQKPWENSHGMPHNAKTLRKYNGLNPWTLMLSGWNKGYTSTGWLSFKQIKSLGGYVRKGEKSTLVYFWSFDTVKKVIDPDTGEEYTKQIPFMRMYNVFNTEQCEGFILPTQEIESKSFEPIEEAERITKRYLESENGPKFAHDGVDRAFYRPSLDRIALPPKETFVSVAEYYSTLFHEMTHSTGHPTRLGIFSEDMKIASFGSEEYSHEELRAELGSSFLCLESGIKCEDTQRNSSAYLANWARVLRAEPKILVSAAGKAQKSTKYILEV